jgi:hypothetical protein
VAVLPAFSRFVDGAEITVATADTAYVIAEDAAIPFTADV